MLKAAEVGIEVEKEIRKNKRMVREVNLGRH